MGFAFLKLFFFPLFSKHHGALGPADGLLFASKGLVGSAVAVGVRGEGTDASSTSPKSALIMNNTPGGAARQPPR